jgi:tellurite resistance protein TerA
VTSLAQGANGPVEGGSAAVTVDWTAPAAFDIDASAYLLTEASRVRDDTDMVFYNQPEGAAGAVRMTLGQGEGGRREGVFQVSLAALPPEIARVVFCLTINDAASKRQTFAQLTSVGVAVRAAGAGAPLEYRPSVTGAAEAALILGELYRRNGQWKFRAVGQGFNGGLAPLARSFGIDVADDPAAAAPPPPVPPPPVAPPPPPAAPPVSLSKISLEKKGQSVSLEKRGSSFGEIVVNLNWSRAKRSGGLFGGGGAGAVDLDLGCLYELQDGELGVVQAIGACFGAFDGPPFIQLSGDDRTGDVAQGETLRINGARWSEIKRVAVFALIYEGAPNWQATDGVVLVTMPDQAPIELRMTEGRNDRRLCGVVLIENDRGQLKATRIVDYFRHQGELDRAHRWGLRWEAGSKD